MKYDLQRTFWLMAAKGDGRRDAVYPGAFDQREYARFVALEPAALAFERFENECFEITEVIVDDGVNLAADYLCQN